MQPDYRAVFPCDIHAPLLRIAIAILLLFGAVLQPEAWASQVKFNWDYDTSGAAGFVLYCGLSSLNYSIRVDVGNTTTYTIGTLKEGATYFCAVTAYDPAKLESSYSSEISVSVPSMTPTGPTLSASPSTLPAGSAVTATWSGNGAPQSTDWIGLYRPGTPATAFIDWVYTSCTKTPGAARAAGSCPLLVPALLAAGTYELRLLANKGFVALATSQQFSVTPGPSVSASPTTVSAGSAVTATWSGIAAPKPTDWIGVFAPGTPATAFINWVYASCTKTPGVARAAGSCPLGVPAKLAPGSYEVRLLGNNGFVPLAVGNQFSVVP